MHLYIDTTYHILPIDCLLIALDAHMFSHNGYGPGTKAQGPRSCGPPYILVVPILSLSPPTTFELSLFGLYCRLLDFPIALVLASIQEMTIQKQLYNIIIDKIPNGWNSLILKRLSDFGVEFELKLLCEFFHDSFEFFKSKHK